MILNIILLFLKLCLSIIFIPFQILGWLFSSLGLSISFSGILLGIGKIIGIVLILWAGIRFLFPVLYPLFHTLCINIISAISQAIIKKKGFLQEPFRYSRDIVYKITANHIILAFSYAKRTYFLSNTLYNKLTSQIEAQKVVSEDAFNRMLNSANITSPIHITAIASFLLQQQRIFQVQIEKSGKYYCSTSLIDTAFKTLQTNGCATFAELCDAYSKVSNTGFFSHYPTILVKKVIDQFVEAKRIYSLQLNNQEVLYVFDSALSDYNDLFLRQQPMTQAEFFHLCQRSGHFHVSDDRLNAVSELALNQLVEHDDAVLASLNNEIPLYVQQHFINSCAQLFHNEGGVTFDEFVALCRKASIFSSSFKHIPLVADITLKTLLKQGALEIIPLGSYFLYRSLISSGKMETVEIHL